MMASEMQDRLINLSMLLNEYRDRIYDLISCTTCSSQQSVQEQLFSETFIDIFKAIKNTKVKHPIHILVYIKAKNAILRNKKVYQKKQTSIKELKVPVDISTIAPVDIKKLNGVELLDFFTPQERVLVVLALRHHMGINELATLFSTSPGAILTRLNRIKTELARLAINTLKEKKETAGPEDTKACFVTRKIEPQYSLGCLEKDEQNKILKHLSKCTSCKNFYSWNQKISDLVEAIDHKKTPQKNDRLIFEKLEKKAIDELVIHYIKTGWKTRLVLLLSSVTILTGLFFFFYLDKKPVQNKELKITEQQVLTKSIIKNILIKITINMPQKDINKANEQAKEIVDMFSSQEKEDTKTTSEDNKYFYYMFVTPTENKESLLEKMKGLDNVNIVQEIIEQEEPNNKVKVEIWVNKNG